MAATIAVARWREDEGSALLLVIQGSPCCIHLKDGGCIYGKQQAES